MALLFILFSLCNFSTAAGHKALNGFENMDVLEVSIESARVGKGKIQLQREALAKQMSVQAEEDLRIKIDLAKDTKDRQRHFVHLATSPAIQSTDSKDKKQPASKTQVFQIPLSKIRAILANAPDSGEPRLVFSLIQNGLQISDILKVDSLAIKKLLKGDHVRNLKDIGADRTYFSKQSKVRYKLSLKRR